jgi:hypothetical protein
MFENVMEIQAQSQAVLDSIVKPEFQRCFQKWER